MKMVANGMFTGSEAKQKKDGTGTFTILRFLGDDGRTVDFVTNDRTLAEGLQRMKNYTLDLNYTVNGTYRSFEILSIKAA